MSKHSQGKSQESANIENNLIHLGLLSSRLRKDSTSRKPSHAQNKGGFRLVATTIKSLCHLCFISFRLKDSVDRGLELQA